MAYPEWRFTNWTTMDLGSLTMASTTNESGSAFGFACGSTCSWFVNFQIQCTQGHEYPAMINAPAGSYPITLKCFHLGERRLLLFDADKDSFGILDKLGEAGFAIPLDSGKFKVSRFSLSGGTQAISKALDVIIERRKVSQEGLEDFTI
ncbi:MAG: hypothetical protein V4444_05615 [Pseudomonadota bacterium]